MTNIKAFYSSTGQGHGAAGKGSNHSLAHPSWAAGRKMNRAMV